MEREGDGESKNNCSKNTFSEKYSFVVHLFPFVWVFVLFTFILREK